ALTSGQAYSNLNVSQDKGDACPSSTQKNYSAIQKPERPVYLRPESLRQVKIWLAYLDGRLAKFNTEVKRCESSGLNLKSVTRSVGPNHTANRSAPPISRVAPVLATSPWTSSRFSNKNLACPTKPSSSPSCNNQTPAYRPVSRTTSACPLSPMNTWPNEPVI
ncbi:hypothetical protein PSTT_14908, partial [Puccinia striiformis]